MELSPSDLQLVRAALITEIKAELSSLDDDLRSQSIRNVCTNLMLDVELLRRIAGSLPD